MIGDRVQIGSDTQLVAPVTVGDDAYVATGTTVTARRAGRVLSLYNPRRRRAEFAERLGRSRNAQPQIEATGASADVRNRRIRRAA